MIKVVLAFNHEDHTIECVGYENGTDSNKLGKELALFLYYNATACFWQGLQQVTNEIDQQPYSCDENATRRHFLGEPQQHEDEEESVFE